MKKVELMWKEWLNLLIKISKENIKTSDNNG